MGWGRVDRTVWNFFAINEGRLFLLREDIVTRDEISLAFL